MILKQREALVRKSSASNANRYMAVLSHLYTVALKEWEWVEDTPFRKIQRLREPRGRVRFLSDEERSKLLAACRENPNPHLYDTVVLALSTGCRKNEILSLTWDAVDLHGGVLVLLDTKNGERRAVPLKGHAWERMKERSRIRC